MRGQRVEKVLRLAVVVFVAAGVLGAPASGAADDTTTNVAATSRGTGAPAGVGGDEGGAPSPSMALVRPWQLGPSPSAHAVRRGLFVGLDAGGISGTYRPLESARVSVGGAPNDWVYLGLAYERRAAWRMCVDCEADAVTATVRASLVRTPAFRAGLWVVGNGTTAGAFDVMPGLGIEGGSRRVRFDLSSPVWSSYDILTTLRVGPEAGVSAVWTDAHRTRASVAGVDFAVQLEHRWRVSDAWSVRGAARYGEEGVGGELGVAMSF